jgi:Rrf2 family protein
MRMLSIASKKNQYALRAVFELAKRQGEGPTKISEIADAQFIPVRFLEVILNQLKRSGLIGAKRGFYGGYYLKHPPAKITVADIMSFLEAPTSPSPCPVCKAKLRCPHGNRCAFSAMWNRVNNAIMQVYSDTTIQDLLENDRQLQGQKSSSRNRPNKTRQGCSL